MVFEKLSATAKKSSELAVATCVFVHALQTCARLSGYYGVVYGA